jgi:hypothetical protein
MPLYVDGDMIGFFVSKAKGVIFSVDGCCQVCYIHALKGLTLMDF